MRTLRPPSEKRCIYCSLVKPRAEFHAHSYTTRTGRKSIRLNSACKACHGLRTKERKAGAPYRAQQREYRVRNRDQRRIQAKNYRAANPDSWFKAHLRSYGLTLDGYQSILEAQNGLCRVCHRAPEAVGKKVRLHIDHDHETGAVRGLLCHQCNVILGLAQDNPATLRRLAAYLEVQRNGSERGMDPGESTSAHPDQHARQALDGSCTWESRNDEDSSHGNRDSAAQVFARSQLS